MTKAVFVLLLAFFVSADAQVSNFIPAGMGGGGALFYPSLSPHDSGKMYIACDMGEFFYSSNGGYNWSVPHFSALQSSNIARVQFTSDPGILYALEGGDIPGVAKSLDAGNTFTPLANDPTAGETYSLFVDPASTQRLLASNYPELYFSANGGASFTLKYSSSDLHIAGAFFKGDSIYVGTNSGLLISTNGGSTFAITNIPGIIDGQTFLSLCGAFQSGTVRLFTITANSGDIWPGIGGAEYDIFQGLYTHDIGGASWTNRTAALPSGHRPFFISCARDNISIAYASGANISAFYPTVAKSTNGGTSWSNNLLAVNNQNVATGWMGYQGDLNWGWAESAMGFTVCSNNPNRLLITDWGFAHYSNDGGANWRQVYSSSATQNPSGAATPRGRSYASNGLEPTAAWQLCWANDSTIIGSFTDIRGIRSTDGGDTWHRLKIDTTNTFSVNTVYYTLKHPLSGTLYAATSSVHDMYQSTYLTDGNIDGGTGQIWSSTNAGATWNMMHNFLHPVVWLASDPTNPNRMYASVVHSTQGGIFVTNDLQNGSGAAWTRVGLPPRTQGHPFNVFVLPDGAVVCTYSGRRASNTFTNSSGVFYSTDGGNSWLDRSDPMMIYWTKDIQVDPHDASGGTWFVTVRRGWGGPPNNLGGLFRTTNRGQSWTRIFDELYAESCTASPVNANEMYASTVGSGLWHTSNLRDASPDWAAVDEYTFHKPTRIHFNPHNPNQVWFCSFGNGLRYGFTNPPLAPVTGLTLHGESGSLVLRWTESAGAASYNVYSGPSPDIELMTVIGNTLTTSYQTAATDTRRFYVVTASD